MKKYYHLLTKNELFNNINEQYLDEIMAILDPEVTNYQKDDSIILPDSEISKIGIVVDGIIQVVKEDIMGNRIIMTELTSGELFGEVFACLKVKKSPVSVLSMTKCTVLFIEVDKITNVSQTTNKFHHILVENLLKIIASKNIMLNDKIDILSKKSTKGKLMAYFNMQSEKHNSDEFTIPFTRDELADYLGVNRSSMSRELGYLRDEGVLAFHKNKIRLFRG